MKHIVFGAFRRGLLTASVIAVSTVSAKAENLADTLVSAYEHSGLLQQNRALLRAADEDVAQIVSQLRPIINWTADITQSFGERETNNFQSDLDGTNFSGGIELSLLLYDFGETPLQIEAAKETVLATRESLRSVEQQVFFRAIQAYMNVLRNGQFVSVRQNNVRVLQEELRAAGDRFEVGEVTRTDVAQAEARLAEAQSGLSTAEGDYIQAVEEFRAAVGRAPNNLRQPTSLPKLSGDVEAAKLIAVRSHPDMLQVRHQVASADLTLLAAEAAMRPEISLFGALNGTEEIDGSDYSHDGSVGVRVTGPIYRGGLLSSQKRQAQARRDAERGNLHEVRHEVKRTVGNSYAVLEAAQASSRSSREQVRAAQVAFDGVQEEAKLGARTTLDVLDAEQDLLDAKTNLISAETDVYIAAYAVLSSTGQLTADELNLNIQRYDPAAYYNLVKSAPVKLSPQGKKLDKVLEALGKD
ncbi:Outer membrane efflux protein BepC precursor [Roseovarius albus]|uniref:Protein CyaE n=1 Tax=Roseovarius albus TaxID=1247867 RepID=A0A1X6Y884_9RHOB|nr:TolC family outer membrane protein [Roseovarius albus]SLN13640.1 Outer membrane efflux protein BepC precursor [Roseovarius albus]